MYQYNVTGSKALAGGATQTLLVVKPAAGVPFKVKQWGISFDSSSLLAGIVVQLIRASTDGTGTASPPTPVKWNRPNDRAAQATILWNLTAEGTLVEVCDEHYLQPLGGLLLLQWPLDDELVAPENGNRICIRVITPASVTPNCRYSLRFEE